MSIHGSGSVMQADTHTYLAHTCTVLWPIHVCDAFSHMQCLEPFDELSTSADTVGSVLCSYSAAESSTVVTQPGCTRELICVG